MVLIHEVEVLAKIACILKFRYPEGASMDTLGKETGQDRQRTSQAVSDLANIHCTTVPLPIHSADYLLRTLALLRIFSHLEH